MKTALSKIYQELGITDLHLKANKLPSQKEPALENLKIAEIDFEGKPFILELSAHKAWIKLKEAAIADHIVLRPYSGFRSILYQKNLIERNLATGRSIDNILTSIAIPGFSEHHTGRAIDFHEIGRTSLEEDFEFTDSFKWLSENAANFHFHLSYPRDNLHGIVYEPWHWFYTGQ